MSSDGFFGRLQPGTTIFGVASTPLPVMTGSQSCAATETPHHWRGNEVGCRTLRLQALDHPTVRRNADTAALSWREVPIDFMLHRSATTTSRSYI
jgi:hypothetical protein